MHLTAIWLYVMYCNVTHTHGYLCGAGHVEADPEGGRACRMRPWYPCLCGLSLPAAAMTEMQLLAFPQVGSYCGIVRVVVERACACAG